MVTYRNEKHASWQKVMHNHMVLISSFSVQKTKEDFGPRVRKTAQALMDQYKNVFITTSKSGKLTKHHFADFVENIIRTVKITNFY